MRRGWCEPIVADETKTASRSTLRVDDTIPHFLWCTFLIHHKKTCQVAKRLVLHKKEGKRSFDFHFFPQTPKSSNTVGLTRAIPITVWMINTTITVGDRKKDASFACVCVSKTCELGLTFEERAILNDKPFEYAKVFVEELQRRADSRASYRAKWRHDAYDEHATAKARKVQVAKRNTNASWAKKQLEQMQLVVVDVDAKTATCMFHILQKIRLKFIKHRDNVWMGLPPKKLLELKCRGYRYAHKTKVRCVIMPLMIVNSTEEAYERLQANREAAVLAASSASSSSTPVAASTTPTIVSRSSAPLPVKDEYIKLYGTFDSYHNFTEDGSAILFGTSKGEADCKNVILYPKQRKLVFRMGVQGPHLFMNKEHTGPDMKLITRFVEEMVYFGISPLEFLAKTGKIVGECLNCGLALSDPHSQVLGMGPVCYKGWRRYADALHQRALQAAHLGIDGYGDISSSSSDDDDDENGKAKETGYDKTEDEVEEEKKQNDTLGGQQQQQQQSKRDEEKTEQKACDAASVKVVNEAVAEKEEEKKKEKKKEVDSSSSSSSSASSEDEKKKHGKHYRHHHHHHGKHGKKEKKEKKRCKNGQGDDENSNPPEKKKRRTHNA